MPELPDADGRMIAAGHRVEVRSGPHQGTGSVDAVDPDAKKIWIKFDPSSSGRYQYIFWVTATDAVKA